MRQGSAQDLGELLTEREECLAARAWCGEKVGEYETHGAGLGKINKTLELARQRSGEVFCTTNVLGFCQGVRGMSTPRVTAMQPQTPC